MKLTEYAAYQINGWTSDDRYRETIGPSIRTYLSSLSPPSWVPLSTTYLYEYPYVRPFSRWRVWICILFAVVESRVRSYGPCFSAAWTFILIKLLQSVEQPISYKLSPRRFFASARAETLMYPLIQQCHWNEIKAPASENETYHLLVHVASFSFTRQSLFASVPMPTIMLSNFLPSLKKQIFSMSFFMNA